MTSDQLTAEIRRITGDEVILMFSMGKDSISAYYQLRKHFTKIHLVFQYLHPDLDFQKESLDYFEQKLEQKIIRVPSPRLYRMINGYLFQSPISADIIYRMNLPTQTFKDYDKYIPLALNCPNAYKAIGIRANDSPLRRHAVNKGGGLNTTAKTFMPIFDWTIENVKKCLRENNVKLPVDYKLWNKTFDGLDYRFIKPLKDNFPSDYEKLKELFPLLDLEILRYEI